MDFKLLGCILLIVGTCIGAGMLALPIATAEVGFIGSFALLIGCWVVMTAGAFLLLEVNLWMPLNSNLITMAKTTIGPFGQGLAWVTYLLLLYSLLCAYTAGGSDLFHHVLGNFGVNLPASFAAILFTVLFGIVVYLGIRSIDYVNRGLMVFKFASYIAVVALLSPYITKMNLLSGDIQKMATEAAIMVSITSFGYASIVPSLRIYFNGDVVKLKKAIFIGSLIPLICYIAWDAVVMGTIQGDKGLYALIHSNNSTSDLVKLISQISTTGSIGFFANLFTSVCVLTSFLGVSLCLVDFLADGLNLQKAGWSKFFLHLLIYLPPLTIVLFFPNIFVKALEYAGIYCVVLLIFMPAWMAWRGRYQKGLKGEFKVWGGKPLLIVLMLVSVVLLIREIMAALMH